MLFAGGEKLRSAELRGLSGAIVPGSAPLTRSAKASAGAWPPGNSEMARRLRAHDWAATSLGPIERWPSSLRSTVDLLLVHGFPMVALWGADLIQIYNDGYRLIMGDKHPAGLGQPTAECWSEVWHINEPIYQRVRRGETVTFEDALFPITRRGSLEDAWFTLTYSPLRSDQGTVAGVLVTLFETSERVLANRKRDLAEAALNESEQRLRSVVQQAPLAIACTGPSGEILFRNAMFDQLWGRPAHVTTAATYSDVYEGYQLDGRPVASTEWPGARAVLKGEVVKGEVLEIVQGDGRRIACWFAAGPIRDEADRITGGVVLFRDVSEERRAHDLLQESQKRQAFLLRLSDALRPLSDPARIQGEAARILGEHLKANRVAYTQVTDDECIIEGDYVDGVSSMVGHHRITSFGPNKVAAYQQGVTRIVPDVAADAFNDPDAVANFAALGVEAGIGVPLFKNSRLVATLVVHQSRPRNWTAEEVALAEETAERTWAALERARAEAALRNSEEKYRSLFEEMDEGFALCELVRDANGRGVDYRYLELNPALVRHGGIPPDTLRGQRATEAFPTIDPWLIETYSRVVDDGESVLVEHRFPHVDRWLRINAFPRGGDRFAVLFGDVTDRHRAEASLRESEERQAFLLAVGDAMRAQGSPEATVAVPARMLGEKLRASRIVFAELDEPADLVHIRDGWTADGVEALPSAVRLSDWRGPLLEQLRAGQTVRYDDLGEPPYANSDLAGLAAIGVKAGLSVPLIVGGRLVFYINIQQDRPRVWTDAERALTQEVAERTWAAVERARAEAALRESEERFRALTTAGTYTVYRMSPDWRIMHQLDSATLAQTAGPIEDWVDKYILDDDRPAVFAAIDAAIRTKSLFELEHRVRLADGGVGWVLSRAVPLLDREGGIAEWFGAGSDVTTRKRAEEALRESEERLRQFGDASQDVLWIRDAEALSWEYLTPAFETIYGLSRAEALSGNNFRNWVELIVPEDRQHALGMIRRVRFGERVAFEYRIRRPADSEVRWLRHTDFPIYDGAGRIIRIGGIGHDVTELKQAEEALAAAEQRQRALVEGIPQLVWRAVDGGAWTWASPQWAGYTGQAEEESHGWGWLDSLHPDDRDKALEAWSHAVEDGGFEVEYRIRHASEMHYHWFTTRAAPVRDEGGAIVEWLGTSTDVNELRELQERQAVLVAELQHRTKNLMSVVRSMADRTMRKSRDLAEFAPRFKDRLFALARVQGLLSRLNEWDRITFDELIAAEFTALDDEGGRVTLEGPDGILLRSSTVQTLSLALHELATNALKYGALKQPEGRLAVRWRLEPSGEGGVPWLHVDWREGGVTMPLAHAPAQGGGMGRELIERALPHQLKAETTYVMTEDGVHCTIALPVSERTPFREPADA